MELPIVDEKIHELISNYETRDPIQLAKLLNVFIIEEDLGEIYGYYNRVNRIKMIHINSRLDDLNKRTTTAHELGHAVLHPSENTPMLSKTTIVSELKIEKEANYFATNLIVDKEKYFEEYNYENVCTYGMLNHYGLPEHFARYI
ncbi:ImmA/IrrE family metallo-endopeptidase [Enterococcus malodoratus]|uniref:ImmA/IrrE family metallo-endopeptidase n=1 Tax=Enterococcus malodoratus TaxID=71451 RepID=UPI0039AEA14F